MRTDQQQMIREILDEVRYTEGFIGKSALDPRVMTAMASIPRDHFVPDNFRHASYENRPLPIGDGQTISQPYIVALMTDLLEPMPDHRVLEVGTGSGYQAAILSKLVKTVYTIEVIETLAASAATRLAALKCDNVVTRCGNGYYGWAEHAPFDGIIVTAAAPYIPPALVEQLKVGGNLVIPVGSPFGAQDLIVVRKEEDGTTSQRNVLAVAFVPLTGLKES